MCAFCAYNEFSVRIKELILWLRNGKIRNQDDRITSICFHVNVKRMWQIYTLNTQQKINLFYVWIIIIVAISTNRSGLIETKQTAQKHGTNLIETKECSWCLVDPMIKIKQNCKKKKTRDSCANKSTHITRAHTTLLSGLAGEYDALISQAWMCRYVPPFF